MMSVTHELGTTQSDIPHSAEAARLVKRFESGEVREPYRTLEGVINRMHDNWTEGAGAHGQMKNIHSAVAAKVAELMSTLGENPSEEAKMYLKSYMDTTIQAMTQKGRLSRVITGQAPDGQRMIYYNALPQVELREDGTVAVTPVLNAEGAALPFKEGATVYAYADPTSYISRLNDTANPLNSDELPAAYVLMVDHLQALKSAISAEGQPPVENAQAVGAGAVDQTLTAV